MTLSWIHFFFHFSTREAEAEGILVTYKFLNDYIKIDDISWKQIIVIVFSWWRKKKWKESPRKKSRTHDDQTIRNGGVNDRRMKDCKRLYWRIDYKNAREFSSIDRATTLVQRRPFKTEHCGAENRRPEIGSGRGRAHEDRSLDDTVHAPAISTPLSFLLPNEIESSQPPIMTFSGRKTSKLFFFSFSLVSGSLIFYTYTFDSLRWNDDLHSFLPKRFSCILIPAIKSDTREQFNKIPKGKNSFRAHILSKKVINFSP